MSFIGFFILFPLFVIFYPFFIIIAKRPIIFKQKRMGKNKKSFTIYKIRTMKAGSEKKRNKLEEINIAPYPMFKAKNDPRFHAFGKTLSKFGIDEFPQLLNILKGEMSFVGPRPLPVNEARLLDSSWDFRYKVKPGILSEWALSKNRYKSLKNWKKLEKETIKNESVKNNILLIFRALHQIIIQQL
jgi:lipopolysaccharide/colanic/teichoic acid biosynthesis glycosyltransferase